MSQKNFRWGRSTAYYMLPDVLLHAHSFQSGVTCQILVICVVISHGRCLSLAKFLDAVKGSAKIIESFLKFRQK